MRGLAVVAVLLAWAVGAAAQPADCPVVQAPSPSMPIGIGLDRRYGLPPGTTAYIDVPMQAPRTDCGEPLPPSDVLRGEPGDLLRGPGPGAPPRQ